LENLNIREGGKKSCGPEVGRVQVLGRKKRQAAKNTRGRRGRISGPPSDSGPSAKGERGNRPRTA